MNSTIRNGNNIVGPSRGVAVKSSYITCSCMVILTYFVKNLAPSRLFWALKGGENYIK